MDRFVQRFADPDELIELETVRSEIIKRDGITVSHDTQQPGWRWSTHIRPLVKTEWCEVRHLGVLVRGQLHVLLSDGREFDVEPMSLMRVATTRGSSAKCRSRRLPGPAPRSG